MNNWLSVKFIRLARFLLKMVLRNPSFRIGYTVNIAMIIYDARDKNRRLNMDACNKVAESILVDIFDCKKKGK